ncbi:PREDICTED: multiple epidermal growth factor-like domains protein 9 [Priapulus caudatus]|uniref:Multiple epidermal growth factor-like domains protein 9 n=1 Tax=Priapulus caudatus TaxID=37621 RepID=A0ABM1EVY9_PRICU|nr:PREDICTED: multiple epidermal growth factor-like domains protein 9 [Priapulus caudatus]
MTSYSIGVSAQYDDTEFRKAGVMTASTRLNVSDDVDCKCNVEGTVNQTFCYDVTKQCWCWEGFTGQHCNKCAAYHYSPYATKECKPCPCLLDHSSGRCYMD